MAILPKTKRITFSFPESDISRIEDMKLDFEVSTTTDVIRKSLTMTEYISLILKDGFELVAKAPNGEEKKLDMLFGAGFSMRYGQDYDGP